MTTVTDLRIDLAAIVGNWRSLQRPGADTAAVLKADAYGTGAAKVAPALFQAGCRHFFVAHLDEALALRPLVPGAMLAVLNGLWPGAAPEFVAHDLRPVLGSLAEIAAWQQAARRAGRPLPALVHIDTGMNRLGLPPAEVTALAEDPALLDGVAVQYMMTHLVSAEDPADPINARQARDFRAACDRLPPAPRSLANSSGLFLGELFRSDLARPGAALYGVNPTPGQPNPMRPVVRLLARILQVREVGAGERVGYNGIWTAGRRSRIATVSVGYADGYLRSLSNHADASFDGTPVPLVGRVSMDLTTFDITATSAQAGDWLELIGGDQTVDALALRAGTNGYEILTSLGPRYSRSYHPA